MHRLLQLISPLCAGIIEKLSSLDWFSPIQLCKLHRILYFFIFLRTLLICLAILWYSSSDLSTDVYFLLKRIAYTQKLTIANDPTHCACAHDMSIRPNQVEVT